MIRLFINLFASNYRFQTLHHGRNFLDFSTFFLNFAIAYLNRLDFGWLILLHLRYIEDFHFIVDNNLNHSILPKNVHYPVAEMSYFLAYLCCPNLGYH